MIRWFRERGIQVGHAWGHDRNVADRHRSARRRRDWDEMSDDEQVDYIVAPGPVAVRGRAPDRRRRRQRPAARRRVVGPAADAAARGS